MDEKKITEFFAKQLERVNYWLAFAEAKNAALIVLNTAIIVFIMRMLVSSNKNLPHAIACLCGIISFISCISLVIALYSFHPVLKSGMRKIKRTDEGKVNLDSINLLFYRKIAECTDYQEYMDNVCQKYHFVVNAELKPLISDYAEEFFVNSEIATRKYKIFRLAIRVDYVVLIVLLILVLVA